jgi:hypothetical protein
MDYLMAVTAAGKNFVVLSDGRSGKWIVKGDRIVTRTGTASAYPQPRRQHLFLSLASPPTK